MRDNKKKTDIQADRLSDREGKERDIDREKERGCGKVEGRKGL